MCMSLGNISVNSLSLPDDLELNAYYYPLRIWLSQVFAHTHKNTLMKVLIENSLQHI
jgi:hypothetical protein